MTLSRRTITEAANTYWGLQWVNHAEVDEFLLLLELEDVAPRAVGGLSPRRVALVNHLVSNPTARGPNGASLIVEVVEAVLHEIIEWQKRIESRSCHRPKPIGALCPQLINALSSDGYDVVDGHLRKRLPEKLDLPNTEDELHELLSGFGFDTSKGHIEQAIAAHTRGDWASANGQLRTFVESLLDEIAIRLAPRKSAKLKTSHARRELLAKLKPPFLLPSLNEWIVGQPGGFFQGFYKRLHPQGSHPGLSDEEDSTFRLHVVLLVASHLLRRLRDRLSL
jgi:hypothetical protein